MRRNQKEIIACGEQDRSHTLTETETHFSSIKFKRTSATYPTIHLKCHKSKLCSYLFRILNLNLVKVDFRAHSIKINRAEIATNQSQVLNNRKYIWLRWKLHNIPLPIPYMFLNNKIRKQE